VLNYPFCCGAVLLVLHGYNGSTDCAWQALGAR
jgi:hypothetical protein